MAYDNKTIDALFQMPNYDGKDYLENGIRSYDLEDIIKRLCKPGTTWKTNEYQEEKKSFSRIRYSVAMERRGIALFVLI